jgi:hypothetical protein
MNPAPYQHFMDPEYRGLFFLFFFYFFFYFFFNFFFQGSDSATMNFRVLSSDAPPPG